MKLNRKSVQTYSRAYWYEKNQWHWFGPLKHLCITSLRFQWCIIWSNCKNFRLSKILIFDEGKMHWNAQKSSDLDKAGFWSRRRRTLHGPKKVYFSWNSMWKPSNYALFMWEKWWRWCQDLRMFPSRPWMSIFGIWGPFQQFLHYSNYLSTLILVLMVYMCALMYNLDRH